jgi:hypothetical protein
MPEHVTVRGRYEELRAYLFAQDLHFGKLNKLDPLLQKVARKILDMYHAGKGGYYVNGLEMRSYQNVPENEKYAVLKQIERADPDLVALKEKRAKEKRKKIELSKQEAHTRAKIRTEDRLRADDIRVATAAHGRIVARRALDNLKDIRAAADYEELAVERQAWQRSQTEKKVPVVVKPVVPQLPEVLLQPKRTRICPSCLARIAATEDGCAKCKKKLAEGGFAKTRAYK